MEPLLTIRMYSAVIMEQAMTQESTPVDIMGRNTANVDTLAADMAAANKDETGTPDEPFGFARDLCTTMLAVPRVKEGASYRN